MNRKSEQTDARKERQRVRDKRKRRAPSRCHLMNMDDAASEAVVRVLCAQQAKSLMTSLIMAKRERETTLPGGKESRGVSVKPQTDSIKRGDPKERRDNAQCLARKCA